MFDRPVFNEKAFDFYPCLKKIRTEFKNDCSQPFSLAHAAAIAALEPKYFGKFFRCKVGIGFKTARNGACASRG
jgi:hypothetical protein